MNLTPGHYQFEYKNDCSSQYLTADDIERNEFFLKNIGSPREIMEEPKIGICPIGFKI